MAVEDVWPQPVAMADLPASRDIESSIVFLGVRNACHDWFDMAGLSFSDVLANALGA